MTDHITIPIDVVEAAAEALGNFVSDLGWSDSDMQAMDNLDAYIARHRANQAARAKLANPTAPAQHDAPETIALQLELESAKEAYLNACKLVADMHAAAVGEVTGPRLGVVEDVAALKAERDEAMKDAERYRYLCGQQHWSEALEKAIDAAIAKAEGGAA